jgi:hypothetical protein
VSAYTVFAGYLSELASIVKFCRLAALLRPRVNEYLRWEIADPQVKTLFQDFLASNPNETRIFQSVVVSIHAGFEQFVLDLIDDGAEVISDRKLSRSVFEVAFPNSLRHLHKANGIALASIQEPKQHWKVDYEELIRRLASTQVGSSQVTIYGRPLGIQKGNLSHDMLEEILDRFFCFRIPWGELCKDSKLQKSLGAPNKTSAEVALKALLNKLLSLRNSLAHSQGSEHVEYDEVLGYGSVCDRFGELLSERLLTSVRGT